MNSAQKSQNKWMYSTSVRRGVGHGAVSPSDPKNIKVYKQYSAVA